MGKKRSKSKESPATTSGKQRYKIPRLAKKKEDSNKEKQVGNTPVFVPTENAGNTPRDVPSEFGSIAPSARRLPRPFPSFTASVPHIVSSHHSPPAVSRSVNNIGYRVPSENVDEISSPERDILRLSSILAKGASGVDGGHRSRSRSRHSSSAGSDLSRLSGRRSYSSDSAKEINRLKSQMFLLSSKVDDRNDQNNQNIQSHANTCKVGESTSHQQQHQSSEILVDESLCNSISILEKYNKPKELGKPIVQYWANTAKKAFNCEMGKDEREKYDKEYLPPPSNVPYHEPPRLPQYVWSRLHPYDKVTDSRLQAAQRAAVAPVVPLLRAIEIASKPTSEESDKKDMLQHLSSALAVIGDTTYKLSARRRSNIRALFNPDFRSLAENDKDKPERSEITSCLLGDNFDENLRKLREASKNQPLMKRPYTQSQSSSSSSSSSRSNGRQGRSEFEKPRAPPPKSREQRERQYDERRHQEVRRPFQKGRYNYKFNQRR